MLTPFQRDSVEGSILPKDSIIIQVGKYPPPYGGVSMRTKRMSKLINKTGGRCVVFSPKQRPTNNNMISFREFLKIMLSNLWRKPKQRILVHLQHTNLQPYRAKWYAFIFFVRLCAGKVVITLGFLTDDMGKLPFHKRFWFKRVTRRIDCYVAVGPHIGKKLMAGGCPENKISIIPGFVPPDEEELTDEEGISEDLKSFLEKHQPIVMANASGVVSIEGRDFYGLDMCLELTARLRDDYPSLGFVYAIAPGGHGSTDNWDYIEKMRQISRDRKIEHSFYIRIASQPFTPLLMRCDIFVRPSSGDGDANSVREALYLGKPVAASDAVWRPEGCLTFKDGDKDDFTKKVDMVLKELDFHKQRISQLSIQLPHYDLLRLYEEILNS